MIGKLTKGKGYRAAAEYLMNGSKGVAPDRGELVDTNLTGRSPREWAKEIAAYRKLRPSLGKAVFHASLSPADGDRELTAAEWQAIGKSYLDAMGFEGCPFVAVIHRDTGRPHLHLLAVRIKPDGTVVSDAKDYQRSEKIIRQIERDWRLTAVESPRSHKNKKEPPMSQPPKPDLATTRQIVFESRLAEASAEAEAMLTGQPRPVTPTLECGDDVSEKQKREYKRDILAEDYRKAIEAILGEQVRLIRVTGQTLSIHTTDGGRIQDNGAKVIAYGMSDEAAAVALIELAMLKGMESIVLRGSDAFLKRAMAIAAAKGLNVTPLDENQLKIWISVQQVGDGAPPAAPAATAPAAANLVPATPQKYQPAPVNPLDLMNGPGKVGQRLAERREDGESGTPPATLRPLSPRKPR